MQPRFGWKAESVLHPFFHISRFSAGWQKFKLLNLSTQTQLQWFPNAAKFEEQP
jgi:hypothetical protein